MNSISIKLASDLDDAEMKCERQHGACDHGCKDIDTQVLVVRALNLSP